MKPLIWTMAAIATAAAVPTLAQYPGISQSRPNPPRANQPRTRQVYIPPIPNWTVGHSQRVGTNQIVEWVPRGQTVHRYTKMITLNSFVPRPGVTPNAVLSNFAQRYRAACPRTTVVPVRLSSGYSGVRMDCPRNPTTGRPETVFARALSVYPAMAIIQYMTTYVTMPTEAAQAREFLGRVGIR